MVGDENEQGVLPAELTTDESQGTHHKSFRYLTTKWLGRDERRNYAEKSSDSNPSKENVAISEQLSPKKSSSKNPSTIQLDSEFDIAAMQDCTKSVTPLSEITKVELSSPERRRRRALNSVKSYFEKNKSQDNFKLHHSDGSSLSLDDIQTDSIFKQTEHGDGPDPTMEITSGINSDVNTVIETFEGNSQLTELFNISNAGNLSDNDSDEDQKKTDSEISSDAITISKIKTSPFTKNSGSSTIALKSKGLILNNQVKMISLFVGDLDPSVTENDLYLFFSGYKGLISVKIPMDTTNNVSLNYGYVNFDTQENANLATDKLNYSVLKGSEIRIMPSVRDKIMRENLGANLFFSNLSSNLTSRIMYDRFKAFGKILSCKYCPDKGTCFISFYEKLSAYKICKQFNQTEMDGKTIGVSVHIAKRDRETFQTASTPFGSLKTSGTYTEKLKTTIVNSSVSSGSKDNEKPINTQYSIFIRNLPINLDDAVIKNLVEPYGTVKSILTRKVPQKNGAWSLITMTNQDAVERSIQNLNSLEIEGKQLYVAKAVPREEKDYARKESVFPKKKLKLLVTDIDLEKDKAMLEKWCLDCDAIKSAEFFSNSLKGEIPINKRLNGYGYIELNDETDADNLIKAISEMGISSYKIKIDVASKEKTEAARYPYVMNQPLFNQANQFKYKPNAVSFSYVDPAKMFQIANFQNVINNDRMSSFQKLENYNKVKLKDRKNFDETKQLELTEKRNEIYHIMWEICVRLLIPQHMNWQGNYYLGFSPNIDILSKSKVSSLTDHLIKFFWNNNFEDFYTFIKENQTDDKGKILFAATPILGRQILESAMYLGVIKKG